MGSHALKIGRIARQLKQRRGAAPLGLRKRAVSHQVPKGTRRGDERIDISDLDQILEIDPVAQTCTAESGVTFVDLVEATLKYRLVPRLVPELKTITVGGAVSGCSVESTSFRFGGFHDSCLSYEVITAKGDVLECTPGSLLFEMMHGSFGTLGILSSLKFRLMPAAPFVRVNYEKYERLADYQRAVRRHFEAQDLDFMDGMIHSPRCHVLCAGRFVDEAPYTSRYDWMRIYYRSTARRDEDYLATPDYFFRYDRGVTNVHPKSAIARLLLGRFLDSSRLLRLAERFPWLLRGEPRVTVDVFIPFSRWSAFLEWYCEEFAHFPLWCVPYRLPRRYEWIAPDYLRDISDDLFVDLAIYGMKQPRGRNCYKVIEDKLLELRGIKTLISHNYYSEDTFWRIWNRPAYARARAVTSADAAFPDLYAKTCRPR